MLKEIQSKFLPPVRVVAQENLWTGITEKCTEQVFARVEDCRFSKLLAELPLKTCQVTIPSLKEINNFSVLALISSKT